MSKSMLTLNQILEKLEAKVRLQGLRQTAKDFSIAPSTLCRYLKRDQVPNGTILLKLMAKLS